VTSDTVDVHQRRLTHRCRVGIQQHVGDRGGIIGSSVREPVHAKLLEAQRPIDRIADDPHLLPLCQRMRVR
jgi:hypothetical protein